MRTFLTDNRDELLSRCKQKVSLRPGRHVTQEQLANGVPKFLEQLIRTLAAEEAQRDAESLRISGPSGGDAHDLSEIGVSATAHGAELLKLGYTVDQVVHDYGDLCQAITELALENETPFAVRDFHTLNRCLDNAIADGVTEFSFQHEARISMQRQSEEKERLGSLIHELRNSLTTARLAVRALELGAIGLSGSTGGVLKRSLATMGSLIARSLDDVRHTVIEGRQLFSVAVFLADAADAGRLNADVRGCSFVVQNVDVSFGIYGNRDALLAALANVVQNAIKFTQPETRILLKAYGSGGQVLIEVHDACGGLAGGAQTLMFMPFVQQGADRSGLGLGLPIARASVEADFGSLTVRDSPGIGCVFTMSFPRHLMH